MSQNDVLRKVTDNTSNPGFIVDFLNYDPDLDNVYLWKNGEKYTNKYKSICRILGKLSDEQIIRIVGNEELTNARKAIGEVQALIPNIDDDNALEHLNPIGSKYPIFDKLVDAATTIYDGKFNSCGYDMKKDDLSKYLLTLTLPKGKAEMLAEQIQNEFDIHRIPYYYKVDIGSTTDTLVLYANEHNLDLYTGVIDGLNREHPQLFEGIVEPTKTEMVLSGKIGISSRSKRQMTIDSKIFRKKMCRHYVNQEGDSVKKLAEEIAHKLTDNFYESLANGNIPVTTAEKMVLNLSKRKVYDCYLKNVEQLLEKAIAGPKVSDTGFVNDMFAEPAPVPLKIVNLVHGTLSVQTIVRAILSIYGSSATKVFKEIEEKQDTKLFNYPIPLVREPEKTSEKPVVNEIVSPVPRVTPNPPITTPPPVRVTVYSNDTDTEIERCFIQKKIADRFGVSAEIMPYANFIPITKAAMEILEKKFNIEFVYSEKYEFPKQDVEVTYVGEGTARMYFVLDYVISSVYMKGAQVPWGDPVGKEMAISEEQYKLLERYYNVSLVPKFGTPGTGFGI